MRPERHLRMPSPPSLVICFRLSKGHFFQLLLYLYQSVAQRLHNWMMMSPKAYPRIQSWTAHKRIRNLGGRHGVDPQIRSAFVLLEEQVIWLYPNRFWRGGEFLVPPTTDITKRPYYIRGAQDPVWSKPYTTAGMEPIIVVATPIWVEGQFAGMDG